MTPGTVSAIPDAFRRGERYVGCKNVFSGLRVKGLGDFTGADSRRWWPLLVVSTKIGRILFLAIFFRRGMSLLVSLLYPLLDKQTRCVDNCGLLEHRRLTWAMLSLSTRRGQCAFFLCGTLNRPSDGCWTYPRLPVASYILARAGCRPRTQACVHFIGVDQAETGRANAGGKHFGYPAQRINR